MDENEQPKHPVGALAVMLIYMGIIILLWVFIYFQDLLARR